VLIAQRPILTEEVVSDYRSRFNEPSLLYIRKNGDGVVTGADVAAPAGVQVHNPELHIATLNSKANLEIELTVERGRGYITAVQNKQAGGEIGRIPVDSDGTFHSRCSFSCGYGTAN